MPESARITVTTYDKSSHQETLNARLEDCFPLQPSPMVNWIHVEGTHQIELIEKIGEKAGLHPLVIEDISHKEQRPKAEDYEDYIFIVLRLPIYNESLQTIKGEQINIVLGKNYLITFQESRNSIFNALKQRIGMNRALIRQSGADFLAYAVIDTVIDQYFTIIEKIGTSIEKIEEELAKNYSPKSLSGIHRLRREIILLRKFLGPIREILHHIDRQSSSFFKEDTRIYLRDIYDHVLQVIETVDVYRDLITGLIDIYLTRINLRMNEIIKILTVVSTIFVPLTFIASFYGMNFTNMPEITWRFSYPAVLTLMILVTIFMLLYMRRKKWF